MTDSTTAGADEGDESPVDGGPADPPAEGGPDESSPPAGRDPAPSDEAAGPADRTPAAPDAEVSDAATSPRRRALLGLVAGGGAGAVAGLVAGRLGADRIADDRPGGPWTHVAPGASIHDAFAGGALAVALGAGEYPIDRPLAMPRGASLRGVGRSTILRAAPAGPDPLDAVISIGGGGPVDGVSIADLVVHAGGLATTGIDLHIQGEDGNFDGEPDAMCRLDDLWVYEPLDDGVWYRGDDAQATITTRVRVRRAGRHGFHVQAPDNWWIACEATTTDRAGTGESHGFEITSSNNHFSHCKAWYCAGHGWHHKGVRTTFTGCEAQDTKGHGWFVEWSQCTLTGCTADTASAARLGAAPGAADGFYVESPDKLVITGCTSTDRTTPPQQRYGFNVPAGLVDDGRFVANVAWAVRDGEVHLRR